MSEFDAGHEANIRLMMDELNRSLGDHFRAMNHERELREQWQKDHERLEKIQRDAVSEALRLQFAEYMRRLDDLNGEAGRLLRVQDTYVPRETYDGYVKDQSAAAAALMRNVDTAQKALEKATNDAFARMETSIQELRDAQRRQAAKEGGRNDTWTLVAAVVLFAVSVTGWIISLIR